ncbi:protein AF-9 [Pseudomyrmex gracilis]|uniref:protein AF-9 n=1 Tax=Pseudomyrmex gracilis TaxID=219809 RepID=UPI000994D92B|nr:protein AF-9 [Pseudomyrmex gracilis]
MAVRITLECGHTSTLRMRTTPEGYTHDWEVFVRGIDNADIYQYIEKVVFLLHDTFRNPKRVLKEPPFVVKESGYAGFIIPIEIYLRNKDEPKKFQITYDLHLQPSGPPINNVTRHAEIFRNPSDEFRKKLLKGGGVMVSSRDGSLEKNDTKTLIGKPKLNGSENKKHRISESKTSNPFHDLFGPPIKTAPVKISPDSKKMNQSDKNIASKPSAVIEKSDKIDKTIKTKEGLHRDNRKDKVDDKKDKKTRDSSKDQLKSKERSKKDLPSPGNKSHSSPGTKRPPSPVAAKKSSTPPPPTAKHSLSPKSKEKEVKKSMEKEKDSKDKEKTKSNSKSDGIDSSKSERKKEKKRHKDDKDKERKDKYKDAADKVAVKDIAKISEKKPERTDKVEKSDKEKTQEYKSSSRDGRKSPKPSKENDKVKDDKAIKVEKSDKNEKSEKTKDGKSDKERQKHKHKKRDKKDKRDSKDREKKEKRERSKDSSEKQNNASSATSGGNPLSTLITEMPEKDSSDSAPSVDDDSLPESKNMTNIKKETEPAISTTPVEMAKPLSPGISMEIKKDKSDRNRKDKSKRSEERESRKRKRNKEDEEISAKRQSTSPPLEPVSSSQSPVAIDGDAVHHSEKDMKKDKDLKKDDRVDLMDQVVNDKDIDTYVEQVAPDSTNSTDVEINEPPIFSEDYVSQLKDLQHKIMTLQDNQELQRVVQLIAETGQYEITKKTFDFDLCALDRRTVQRLQQFFSAS